MSLWIDDIECKEIDCMLLKIIFRAFPASGLYRIYCQTLVFSSPWLLRVGNLFGKAEFVMGL